MFTAEKFDAEEWADLFQKATIQPATDFESLERVFVITDYRTIDTSIFDTLPEDLLDSP